MRNPIIQSLLDTDLYKFTMMQCVFHHFKSAQVDYYFQSRKPIDLKPLQNFINEQIDSLCQIQFTEAEINYLSNLNIFKNDFLNYLRDFQLQRSQIKIFTDDQLLLKISGPWLETILFEIPILAIISESHYQHYYPHHDLTIGKERLFNKINFIASHENCERLKFSEFGTRRRFSHDWQKEVLHTLQHKLPDNLLGTSNLYFAMQLNLKPVGTMAHEYLQAAQVLAPDLKHFQKFALQTWLQEYNDILTIALTDVINMDTFLRDFDKELAIQYKGLRQDSGNPIEWGHKALAHYKKLGVDAKDKTFVFSDGLDVHKACEIFRVFNQQVKLSFGIGTNLTNDVGPEPLDMVIKLFHVNDKPVIKISDSPGKLICDDLEHLKYLKQLFELEGNV